MDKRPANKAPRQNQNSLIPFPNSQSRNGTGPEVPDEPTYGQVISATKVAQDEGVCDTTIWRRCKQGLLTSVNIAGRAYITIESLREFYRRARAGEFAKEPHGACVRK
jgi:hypothetical protein